MPSHRRAALWGRLRFGLCAAAHGLKRLDEHALKLAACGAAKIKPNERRRRLRVESLTPEDLSRKVQQYPKGLKFVLRISHF